MSNVNDLINKVALTDVLSQETKERPEMAIEEFAQQINTADFAPDPEKEEIQFDPSGIKKEEPEPEPEEPYDAEAEATKLINLIDVGNTMLLSPFTNLKCRSARGGKKVLDQMKVAYQKKISGQKLNEDEARLMNEFDAYKADVSLLTGDIPFTDHQRDMLIKAAIPFCEETRMKVNSKFGFWGALIGVEAQKITKILMS